ncbi:MAG: hypothetical protein AABZ06_05360, partial [Bdellovibrionota bacterium]
MGKRKSTAMAKSKITEKTTEKNTKKTTAKILKFKVDKLEERIAPSMIGGGIVDPGTVEAPTDAPLAGDTSGSTVTATQVESTGSTSDYQSSSSQYVDQ